MNVKSLEQIFNERAMKERLALTPRTPRRLENEEDKVNTRDHETYRSGVWTLLYLTKHSRPDISNPVRELSKTMDAPVPAHLKEMCKLISFVLSTKDYGLKFKLIKSIRKWVLKARRQDYCIWICYLFLWNINCLEKQRDEECCTINH